MEDISSPSRYPPVAPAAIGLLAEMTAPPLLIPELERPRRPIPLTPTSPKRSQMPLYAPTLPPSPQTSQHQMSAPPGAPLLGSAWALGASPPAVTVTLRILELSSLSLPFRKPRDPSA
ncbi:hypothetical protein CC78DRAFT_573667 [Lojkania enalia]|uniref:Uncharacterized protein n=1 Tax=Lojkania enalia TaxID=147567 RepID=A0A9P4NC85_9PLEO|nr:hypothetical protein CC78DRAFT_573667 [Didymosphaeria enalia]